MRRWGREAVDYLIHRYPAAADNFGNFPTVYHLATELSGPNWIVVEDDLHWIFFNRKSDHVLEPHWFCPTGADVKVLRGIFLDIFHNWGITRVEGVTPPDNKGARIVNRALGAEKEGELYVLTKARFFEYNEGRPLPED